MRIVLLVHQFLPNHSGGTEVLVLETARHLRLRGHDVHVFTAEPDETPLAGGANRLESSEVEGIRVHRIRRSKEAGVDRFRSHYDNESILEVSRSLFRSLRPDVVHIFHLYRLSTSVAQAAREYGAAVVFTATDFWTICPTSLLKRHDDTMCNGPDLGQGNCLKCLAKHAPPLLRKVLQLLPGWALGTAAALACAPIVPSPNKVRVLQSFVRRRSHMLQMLQGCDAIIAPTAIMERMLAGNGVTPGKIVRLGFGLNTAYTDRFRNKTPSPNLRLGFIGQLVDHKGPHVLLEAYRLLRAKGLPLLLRIWGDPRQLPAYFDHLQRLVAGCPEVEFCGIFANSKIGEIFTEMDALVVPSLWYENAPLVVLTALATRTPVIASDVPGISEQVKHGRNGLLFPRGNSQGLANLLGRLHEEPGLLSHLRAGIAPVKTMTEQAAELECLYGRLLSRKAAPCCA